MNQDLVAALRTIPTTGQPLPYHEIDVDLGSLGSRVLQVYACPIDWDDPRDRTMIFLAMEDVTDRKREQERKQQLLREQAARIEAERANRRKDEFLAVLAHELRNPLAPILNSVLVLGATNAQPSDLAWALKVLERQVRHMSRLIEDLLEVSRVMRGAIQLRKEPSDLSKVTVISGFEVASKLRARPEFDDVIIIAVSGCGQEDTLKRSGEAGFDDYAVKPIDLDKLNGLMRRTRRQD